MCAKNGILVKTSEILETASQIDTIVFDKTGTLTYGNLKISEIKNYSKYKEKELLERLISIGSKSPHPISTAFKELGASQQYKEKVVKELLKQRSYYADRRSSRNSIKNCKSDWN